MACISFPFGKGFLPAWQGNDRGQIGITPTTNPQHSHNNPQELWFGVLFGWRSCGPNPGKDQGRGEAGTIHSIYLRFPGLVDIFEGYPLSPITNKEIMLDASIIRQRYLSMSDDQLIALAKNEGYQLTPEAFELMREEFARRNLDFAPLETAEQEKTTKEETVFLRSQEMIASDFNELIWHYAFDEKKKGTPNELIHDGLLAKGLSEENATMIIQGMKFKASQYAAAYDKQTLRGALIFGVGALITIGTYSMASESGGSYVVAWGAIVFGALRIFRGVAGKNKYEAVADRIALEESIGN